MKERRICRGLPLLWLSRLNAHSTLFPLARELYIRWRSMCCLVFNSLCILALPKVISPTAPTKYSRPYLCAGRDQGFCAAARSSLLRPVRGETARKRNGIAKKACPIRSLCHRKAETLVQWPGVKFCVAIEADLKILKCVDAAGNRDKVKPSMGIGTCGSHTR